METWWFHLLKTRKISKKVWLILWGPWMIKQTFMAIHPIAVGMIQCGQTSMAINRADIWTNKNIDLIADTDSCLSSKITKVITIHPEVTMNVWPKCHDDPFNSGWYVSLKAKNVNLMVPLVGNLDIQTQKNPSSGDRECPSNDWWHISVEID